MKNCQNKKNLNKPISEHRLSRGEVVLKAINCNLVTVDEFYRLVSAFLTALIILYTVATSVFSSFSNFYG
jgi:uncharacterized Tic20 family protein